MSAERDELARDIFIADNWRFDLEVIEEQWKRAPHQPDFRYAHAIASALIAKGYRRPRTVTTVEELDALPIGSVVLDRSGKAWHSLGTREWWVGGVTIRGGHPRELLPATVLHVGGAK